ncbi:P63C domain-containing protein [Carnimonas bestiolae]|uniref:P63C domain-containing protein n=1 Tax=Carnimonas bestiolae TaxID=3402172 RepID=UPI003EDBA43E
MTDITVINLHGIQVRIDEEGRYCLNDLHKAAKANGKAGNSQRPGEFLKTAQVQRFVDRLTDANNVASVVSIKGGKRQGTYAHELVVTRYAAWIDVDFEIDVYATFQQQKKNEAMVREGAGYALELLVRPEAAEWTRRFPEDYYRALARMTNTRHLHDSMKRPNLWGQITRRWIYSVIMPPDILAEIDARKHDGEKLHQWLTDGGAEVLDRQIQSITMLANSSVDYSDFKSRCQQIHGDGQLRLIYPAA